MLPCHKYRTCPGSRLMCHVVLIRRLLRDCRAEGILKEPGCLWCVVCRACRLTCLGAPRLDGCLQPGQPGSPRRRPARPPLLHNCHGPRLLLRIQARIAVGPSLAVKPTSLIAHTGTRRAVNAGICSAMSSACSVARRLLAAQVSHCHPCSCRINVAKRACQVRSFPCKHR